MDKPRRILIIEDDDSIAETMTMLLEDEGYSCRRVNSIEDGIADFDKVRPDLILLDCVIKGDGSPFVRHVREADENVPITLVTAISAPEAVAQALKIKDLIKKPFAVEDLINLVRHYLSAR